MAVLGRNRNVVKNNREVKGIGKSHRSSDVPDLSGAKKVGVVEGVN